MRAASFSFYASRFGTIPPLTLEEEKELGRQIFELHSHDAQRTLVERHIPLVLKLVKDFNYDREKYDTDDLISDGIEGLMAAIPGWKPEMQNRFSTYATWWVRDRIFRSVLDSHIVGVPGYTQLDRDAKHSIEVLSERLHRMPTDEEVATHSGLSKATVRSARFRSLAKAPAFLDEPVGYSQQGELSTMGELFEDQRALPPDLLVRAREELGLLEERFSELKANLESDRVTARNRDVFKFFYGLDDESGGTRRSLRVVMERFGVSSERVHQIVLRTGMKIGLKMNGSVIKNHFADIAERIELLRELVSLAE